MGDTEVRRVNQERIISKLIGNNSRLLKEIEWDLVIAYAFKHALPPQTINANYFDKRALLILFLKRASAISFPSGLFWLRQRQGQLKPEDD